MLKKEDMIESAWEYVACEEYTENALVIYFMKVISIFLK